jgi:hypothetical protein
MMVFMAIAYVCIIAAIILDYAKIRKLVKKNAAVGDSSKLTPKQLKHEQRQAEAAQRLEEAKKAQRQQKRAASKLPIYRKPATDIGTETAVIAETEVGEPASMGEPAVIGTEGSAADQVSGSGENS